MRSGWQRKRMAAVGCSVLAVSVVVIFRIVARFHATHVLVIKLSSPLAPQERASSSPNAWKHYLVEIYAAAPREDSGVKQLQDAGADPNARSADYRSASMRSYWVKILRRLLGRRVTGPAQWTSVLGLAIDRGAAEVREVLAHGGNPRLPVDSDGGGALGRAMQYWGTDQDRCAELKLLLQYGAAARSEDGAFAVAIAADNGDPAALALLRMADGMRWISRCRWTRRSRCLPSSRAATPGIETMRALPISCWRAPLPNGTFQLGTWRP